MILEQEKRKSNHQEQPSTKATMTEDSRTAPLDGTPTRMEVGALDLASHRGAISLSPMAFIDDIEDIDSLPPRLVIRGAQSTTPPLKKDQKSIIDWLAFTSNETTEILKEFVNIFIPKASFFPSPKGYQGYKSHFIINFYGKNIGILAYGGNNNRPYLSLSGESCRLIKDWHLITHYLRTLEEVKISRIDIAVDYYFGEVSKESIDLAHSQEKFKLPKSRNQPHWDPRNPTGGDGYPLGWTRYVGKRESGKLLRAYHKGAEQFGKIDPILQDKVLTMACWEMLKPDDIYNPPDFATFKDWVRVEIEYSAKNRVLSIDMIEDRDDYFSGAYPYLEEILPMATPERPKTIPNSLEIDIEVMFNNIKNQYGSFLTTMLSSGMTPQEILKKCINGKQSQRIIKAGGLEIINPYDPTCLD